jgi:hypothetical protein
MGKSNELRNFVLSGYKAMRNGDVGWWERHLSQREGALMIGTDPDEWWAGYAVILQAVKPQVEGMAGSIIEGDPQAYVEGTVGWYADSIEWKLPNGVVVSARVTGVCTKEDGEWKFLQSHFSIGVPNEEAFG